MEKSNHFIWMPLIGFDRDKEDMVVSAFPLMPCKLLAAVTTSGKGDGAKAHLMQVEDPNAAAAGFIGKVQPCGVSIFDVTVE